MAKRLIINADDFGLNSSVNEAVERAHTEGILTSTTMMTNMADAKKAIKIAKTLPELGVGVHLNLFKGKPISSDTKIECLVNKNGDFRYSAPVLAMMASVLHNVRKAIRIEMAEQIQWLIKKKIKPTHLDSHKHFHCVPAVYSIVCDLAREFKIGAVRWCWEPKGLDSSPWPLSSAEARKSAKWIRRWAAINRRQDKSVIKTEAFVGMTHLGRVDMTFLKAVSLYSHAETTELMTHPSTEDDSDEHFRPVKFARKAELEALCDERAKQYFEDAGFELVNYGQL
ncbi:MAG: ChbG/HpnK family deacetylase [Phycisphaerales bacterium]|jgi:hopanoid biosynthesis associated protein HpnK